MRLAIEVNTRMPKGFHPVCATTDPELWFPNKGQTYHAARQWCMVCPFRVECLEFALDRERGLSADWRFGMYGATTPPERDAIDQTLPPFTMTCNKCGTGFETKRRRSECSDCQKLHRPQAA